MTARGIRKIFRNTRRHATRCANALFVLSRIRMNTFSRNTAISVLRFARKFSMRFAMISKLSTYTCRSMLNEFYNSDPSKFSCTALANSFRDKNTAPALSMTARINSRIITFYRTCIAFKLLLTFNSSHQKEGHRQARNSNSIS